MSAIPIKSTDPKHYFPSEQSAKAYAPRGHSGTTNYRLVSTETGGRYLEVLIGKINPGEGASPHFHPGVDQFCWVLEGCARVEVAGITREIGPGKSCFFPAEEPHTFVAIGEHPVRVLIAYGPPYNEVARVECQNNF